jgi:hypothetical protein
MRKVRKRTTSVLCTARVTRSSKGLRMLCLLFSALVLSPSNSKTTAFAQTWRSPKRLSPQLYLATAASVMRGAVLWSV